MDRRAQITEKQAHIQDVQIAEGQAHIQGKQAAEEHVIERGPAGGGAPGAPAQKRDLRRYVRALRKEAGPEEIRRQSRAIFRAVRASDRYREAGTIFAYMSLPGEVETDSFLLCALEDGKRIAVPRTDLVHGRIRFFYLETFAQLEEGVMGIREPGPGCLPADDDEEALMILPGLAFDPACRRVGYGGGFYDRYLGLHGRHPTLAVACSFQIFDRVPQEEGDRRADVVCTPDRIYERGFYRR